MSNHPRIRAAHVLLILPLLVALPCLAGTKAPLHRGGDFLAIGPTDVPELPPAPRCTADEAVLHDQFRLIFENELLWTRMVAVGVLHDLSGHDAYIKRLLDNYEAFEVALTPFYGADDAEKVGALVEEHVRLTSEVFHEILAGYDLRTILPQWYANGEEIAAHLSALNPEYWPSKEMSVYWRVYLDDILRGGLAFHEEEWAVDVEMLDVFHSDCLAMADYMTSGIVRQCAAPR